MSNKIYLVTGYYYNSSKRFPTKQYSDICYALGINLWKGNVWEKDLTTGKRKLIKSVNN